MRISSKWIVAAGCIGIATALSPAAFAQERVEEAYMKRPVRAPKDAFELGATAAYSQALASPAPGFGTTDLTKAGGAFGIQVGYRFVPEFALHLFGQYNEFAPGNALSGDAATRGGTAGISGTFHILPYQRVDPWVRVGSAYRMLWVTGTGAVDATWHGFEWGRLDIGADLRTSEDVSIGPMVGVGLSEFIWRNPSGDVGDVEIQNKRVAPYIYAGMEARFDIGGIRQRNIASVAAR
jgi:hypothetical protein